MNALVRIKRYDPEQDKKPYWAEYRVEADPIDRLLDTLNTIKWNMDGTLTYRRSCAHGVCGSDAMRINGRNRLACKVLMRDVGSKVTIEPMLGFPVIRDLVVDMDQFFDKYCKAQRNAHASTKAPSASSAVPVQAHVLPSGVIPIGLDLPQLSTHTALSSIAAIKGLANASASWVSVTAYGVAAPSSTAPMPVHAAFLLLTSSNK